MKMMFKLVFLFAVLLLSSTLASAQTVSSIFSCNGNNYSIIFTDADFVDTPSWNPLKDARIPPPLSLNQALEIAKTTLNQCHPKANNNWNLSSSLLLPMGIDKCVYMVRFQCPYADCTYDKSIYGLYIKLDGTVIRPKPDAQPIEIPPAFTFGQNLEKQDCRMLYFPCAVSEYTKIIELNPKQVIAYFNRGLAFQKEKKYDEEIAGFSRVIELNPEFPDIYRFRGLAYFLKNEYELAIADFNKALELNPKNASSYYSRGATYDTKKDHDKAVTDYNKAIELAPNAWLYRYVRGWFYYNNGKKSLAEADFKKAKELENLEDNKSVVKQLQPTYPQFP